MLPKGESTRYRCCYIVAKDDPVLRVRILLEGAESFGGGEGCLDASYSAGEIFINSSGVNGPGWFLSFSRTALMRSGVTGEALFPQSLFWRT